MKNFNIRFYNEWRQIRNMNLFNFGWFITLDFDISANEIGRYYHITATLFGFQVEANLWRKTGGAA